MKRYQLFLVYYTLITSLVLFIWSLIFAPKPQGFLLTLIVIPTSIYFWLLVLGVSKLKPSAPSSENQTQEKQVKLPLIALITLFISSFISAFSIFVYPAINSRLLNSESASLSVSGQVSSLKLELENQNKAFHEEMVREFGEVKDQLAKIKPAPKVTEAATNPEETPVQVGTVTIKDQKNKTVNIYQEKNLNSNVIGKAEFGKNYTYTEKDQNWYLILLGEKEGFISNQFVKEVDYLKSQ